MILAFIVGMIFGAFFMVLFAIVAVDMYEEQKERRK